MQKIIQLKIRNFKSIKEEIVLNFEQLTCIVGMNGSGKSTILQAIDFVSHLMSPTLNMDAWLEQRNWKMKDLTPFKKGGNIYIETLLQFDDNTKIKWVAEFNPHRLCCIDEKVFLLEHNQEERLIFEFVKNRIGLKHKNKSETQFIVLHQYKGSLLSELFLNDKHLNHYEYGKYLVFIRDFLSNIQSLELLSPAILRKLSRKTESDKLGIGGERLSGYISNLSNEKKGELQNVLKQFYPNIKDFDTQNLRGGWKELIFEENKQESIKFSAIHVNDGLLRILAIITQIYDNNANLILLDEIENGINQEIIQKLVEILLNAKKQIIITTHSPLILNYIDDETAKQSIFFAYRLENGTLKIAKFFDVIDEPEMLDYIGPGEVYANVNLNDLATKLIQQNQDMEKR